MKINVSIFGGVAPKIPPRYLEENMAQEALNCDLKRGSLNPINGLSNLILSLDINDSAKTIYRFGQDTKDEKRYWFAWDKEVNVCRGQISGDTSEWTFYTGDGPPKATYARIATTSLPYPFASRRLGLKRPTEIITGSVQGDADPIQTKTGRTYTWTWVNQEAGLTMESAPAPASPIYELTNEQTVSLTGFPTSIGGLYHVTHKRIYRSTDSEFLFVAEIPATQEDFLDDVVSDSLGEAITSGLWDEPPEDLRGIVNLPNGGMSGFIGRDIYFCVPYRPYAWPESYIQSVDYPVVGLGVMDTTMAVLTTGVAYFIQGSQPDAMTVVRSDLEQACVSSRSIVSWGGVVLYASPDGLMMISPRGSNMVSENFFTREQWNDLNPETIHAYHHDNKYLAFWENESGKAGFVYDLLAKRFTFHDIKSDSCFNDLLFDKLFVCQGNEIFSWNGGDKKEYLWKSKKYTFPHVMGFSCAQVEAEEYPIFLSLTIDGEYWYTKEVVSREAFRLPARHGREITFSLRSDKEVFSASLGQAMQDLQST